MFILVLATLLNIHEFINIDSMTGYRLKAANMFVNSVIPSTLLIVFSTIIYKRLKGLLSSGFYNSGANAQLKKTVFRAKITISITIIFVLCQVLLWFWLVMLLVSVHYRNMISCRKMLSSIQVFLNNCIDVIVNPISRKGLLKSMAYFMEIGPIMYVINCSANFFAYQCLAFKEKKLKKERKQEREMERMNPTSTNSTRMTSFD